MNALKKTDFCIYCGKHNIITSFRMFLWNCSYISPYNTVLLDLVNRTNFITTLCILSHYNIYSLSFESVFFRFDTIFFFLNFIPLLHETTIVAKNFLLMFFTVAYPIQKDFLKKCISQYCILIPFSFFNSIRCASMWYVNVGNLFSLPLAFSSNKMFAFETITNTKIFMCYVFFSEWLQNLF